MVGVGAARDRRVALHGGAAVAPSLRPDQLTLLARYSLWTFLLDDQLDDPAADPAVLDGLVERLSRLANGDRIGVTGSDVTGSGTPGPPTGAVLDVLLAELVAAFRSYGGDELVLARFADALCDAMRAGVEHTVLSVQIRQGRADPPSAGDYLAVAARHVNYRSFALLLTLLVSQGAAGERVDAIDAALVPAI